MTIQINGTSGISGVDGSATTPALQGTDTNTGISFGTDEVNIVTGGSTRATVDSSGRLLVGTSSTSANATALFAGNPSGNYTALYLAAKTTSFGTNDVFANINFTDSGHTVAASIGCGRDGGTWTSGSSQPTSLVFSTTADGASSTTTRLTIKSDGLHVEPAIYNATGAGSTVVVNSSGEVLRTSSSLKYKTDVEDLQDQYADALLNARPVWYRSTSKYDNPSWGWWGFIAEEIADIDPRLVGWKTTEVVNHEDGSTETVELDTPIAEDVYYDRFVPHLLNLIKRQKEAIEALETRVAQLEGGAS